MRSRIFLLLLCLLCIFPSCTQQDSSSSLDHSLAGQFDFYEDSVSVLRTSMKLTDGQADEVFRKLVDAGVNGRITYAFENTDDEGATYYRIWWGSNRLDAYLSDGVIQKIIGADGTLYTATNEGGTSSTDQSDESFTAPERGTDPDIEREPDTKEPIPDTEREPDITSAPDTQREPETEDTLEVPPENEPGTSAADTRVETSSKQEDTTVSPDTTDVNVPSRIHLIVNKKSKVFHIRASCQHVKRMKDANRQEIEVNAVEEAIQSGYKPCGTCAKAYR